MSVDHVETGPSALDQNRVEEFAGQVVGDIAAVLAGATMYIGHHAGLYAAMADGEPRTPEGVAERAGAHPRYVREWLGAQTASGYVHYEPGSGTYWLPPEHAAVLADATHPAYLGGASDAMAAIWAAAEPVAADFTAGRGVPWHAHDPRMFSGTEELFRPSYEAFLTSEWIPSLDGIEQKLTMGGRVADVGCGHGVSTITMARAYPASHIHGFDGHEPSITTARERAAAAGVTANTGFEVAQATELPGTGYDLVCFFDALHDMGDPVAALVRAREALSSDGAVMLIEPLAGDRVEDNLSPVSRMFYSASTLVCTANGIAQGNHPVLGAQAGEAALRDVLTQAGFTRVRRTADAPINLILEARP
ncbi:methyltransferase domain-containing protein [Haloechinothrix sp. YIM 98757]|uniref:Methyltransferase domain-containing protein n=1 Tax=Haloechinothrix aidingensis TaxID=2752311 RepID=A0A838A1T0_9PSEU|nr:methyltransferase domain-containing protein [Haloechinothrix aidingensis]MBA0125113.1 methyltransferase domain-containing protein [Haloechinothrix aidingensis]